MTWRLDPPDERREVAIVDHQRPRWRFRISTVMLLVIIVALSLALVVEHRERVLSEQRALASEQRARAEAQQALAEAQLARDQAHQAEVRLRKALDEAASSVPRPSGDSPGRATQAGAKRKEGGQ